MTNVMSLRDEVVAAFDGTPYPGDERLIVYDPAGRDYDETFQLLKGRTWRDMPTVEFIYGDTPIPDLAPEAFHYYMPALLLASLDDTEDANEIAGSLTFYLSPSSARCTTGEFPYDDTAGYNLRMSLFTLQQREVIARVLDEYVARGWESEEEVAATIYRLRHEGRSA